ncbi:MAG: ATP-binding cassette domain-containing protein [Caldilineaceae bacterium]
MIVLNLDRISFTYISQPIFQNLSWEIHSGRCVGLVGPNGCGKSTLLKLITGELTSDGGFLVRAPNLRIGYLRQEPRLTPGNTVLQEALTAFTELAAVEQALTKAEQRLADPAVYGDEKALAHVLDEQARLLDEYRGWAGRAMRAACAPRWSSLALPPKRNSICPWRR